MARLAVAGLGLGLFAWTIADAGPETLLSLLPRAAALLPLAIALEAARIGLDALSTRAVLAGRGAIPFRALFAAQLAAQGVMGVFPAGRSASEATKAALLSSHVGVPAAVAMGTANQANVLIGSALFSLACLAGAMATTDGIALPIAIGIHFAVLTAAGVGLRVLATHPGIEAFFLRRAPRLGARAGAFHEASRDTPVLAPAPIAWMVAGRAVQTLEYWVLARAVGLDVSAAGALAVQGVNLVAAALGVMVPGQLGTAELVFRQSAEALGTDHATAVAIALLARVPQLTWVGTGLVVLLVWQARRRAGTA